MAMENSCEGGVHRLIGGTSISLGSGVLSGSRRRLGLAKGIGYPLARGCSLQGLVRAFQGLSFVLVRSSCCSLECYVDLVNIWYVLKMLTLDLKYGMSIVVPECMVSLF